MTTPPTQSDRRQRAVWLTRVPDDAARPHEGIGRDQRFEAHQIARKADAEIIGEFVYSSRANGFSDEAWGELLGFLDDRRATRLIVLDPDEMAQGVHEYGRRTRGLARARIELSCPPEPGQVLVPLHDSMEGSA